MRTLKQLADEATAVQNACNMSGVAQTFAKAMLDLVEHQRALRQSNKWVSNHPITRAYMSKMLSLSNYQIADCTFACLLSLSKNDENNKPVEGFICPFCGRWQKIANECGCVCGL
jgi:hypothetical protein